MRYAQGQPVRVTQTITDLTGALVNAGSLALTLQHPDATQTVYSSPVNDSTGVYHQDIPTTDLTQLGRYQYKWVATGTGAGVSTGGFDVYDPFEVAILSLQDAKAACNIPQSVTAYDSELRDMTATTESILERLTGGPIVTRQVSETSLPCVHWMLNIVLKYRPIVAVVSITDWLGVSFATTDVKINTQGNFLYRTAGLPFVGTSSVNYLESIKFDVVYTAGWGTAPGPAFLTAARIIISDLWSTQRGPNANPGLGGGATTPQQAAVEASYGAPYQALRVLSPYLLEAYI